MSDPANAAPGREPDAAATRAGSPDVDAASDAAPMPGVHRGGFSRLPTAPVDVTTASAPPDPDAEPGFVQWTAPAPAPHRGLAGWALLFATIGLVFAFFVGWGFPIGVVAVASAGYALRRPTENRALAAWALAIGILSLLYSAGWLIWAATRPV